MTGIDMDGKHYRVRGKYETLTESAELVEGINEGKMLSKRHERDLEGTFYSHSLEVEPDPRHPEDYDQLFDDLSAPVPSHVITMPHGQGTVTYEAEVSGVQRFSRGVMAGVRRWSGITASFSSIRPVRTPGEENQ